MQRTLQDRYAAMNLIESTLSEAVSKVDDLGPEEFKVAKNIIELLMDQLAKWKGDAEDLWA